MVIRWCGQNPPDFGGYGARARVARPGGTGALPAKTRVAEDADPWHPPEPELGNTPSGPRFVRPSGRIALLRSRLVRGGWRSGEKNFWRKMKFGVRARGVCVNR